jgi:hypothetical protein
MDDTVKARVEATTAEAIASGPFEDFREAYRERLRWLKESRPDEFARALKHYEALAESIADGGSPIDAWLDYGRRLGELSGAGKLLAIDATGRAHPATGASSDELLLHLPDDTSVPALALAIPRSLSDAQKASLDLLVRRKLALE